MNTIRVVVASSLFLIELSAFGKTSAPTPVCKGGSHWVHAHFRRSYVRADGVPVTASNVASHCQADPPSYAQWAKKLKNGYSDGWKDFSVKPGSWSEEEKERLLEALTWLPDVLLKDKINGLYRFGRSSAFGPNPADGHGNDIVIYDAAFGSGRNLARILSHEFAHVIYSQFSGADARSYNSAAQWLVKLTSSGKKTFIPMREKYVEDDGREGPNEDFSNNIEYCLFNPDRLKDMTPRVYGWIRARYGDSFKVKKGATK